MGSHVISWPEKYLFFLLSLLAYLKEQIYAPSLKWSEQILSYYLTGSLTEKS